MSEIRKDVDRNAAFIIELIAGIFGFLGIGYLYSGLITEGIIRLVAWIAIMAFVWTCIAFLIMVIVGFCCVPFMVLAQFAVPIWSAISLKRRLDEELPEL